MSQTTYNEFKYLVTEEHLAYVRQILDALYGGSDPFAVGTVDSIYYDDLCHRALRACLNGDAIGRKVRLRGYGDDHYPVFQVKTKDLHAVSKLKQSLAMAPFCANDAPTLLELARLHPGQTDFQALVARLLCEGEMIPVLQIKYRRYRYRIQDYRVTLDTDITCTALSGGLGGSPSGQVELPAHVLEVKTFGHRPHLPLLGLIKLAQTSFSKFAMGIILLRRQGRWVS